MDRTGLKILENNKNIQSIISVDTNILLRIFGLEFLGIACSTSCYEERVNFENTLYSKKYLPKMKKNSELAQFWNVPSVPCMDKSYIRSVKNVFSLTIFLSVDHMTGGLKL
jgi:hypothetical protein